VAWQEHHVVVDGARTRVLEAGDRDAPAVVLIHYCGHGATVEEAWERTIPALATRFRVLAPEQLGFGATAKLFDFDDPLGARVRHITHVLELFGVESAHFVGVSTAGTMMLSVAASERPAWPIERIIGVSAVGGRDAGPEVSAVLRAFDGTFDSMDALLGTLYPDRWWDDAYVERRLAASRRPGAWEVVAAERLRPPWAADAPSPIASDGFVDYELIDRPVLLVAGAKDKLRRLDALPDRAARIRNCRTRVFDDAGHLPHIQLPDEFNALALEFLQC
jgi:pimeloyl-ACP methyl ester carboxylesterase